MAIAQSSIPPSDSFDGLPPLAPASRTWTLDDQQVLDRARHDRPGVRYARSRCGLFIGGWSESLKRFVIVAAHDHIEHRWVDMPHELLIGGKPVVDTEHWIEK